MTIVGHRQISGVCLIELDNIEIDVRLLNSYLGRYGTEKDEINKKTDVKKIVDFLITKLR